MYDNILNRSLRFIGNVSERAKNVIEQVCQSTNQLNQNKMILYLFSCYVKVRVND